MQYPRMARHLVCAVALVAERLVGHPQVVRQRGLLLAELPELGLELGGGHVGRGLAQAQGPGSFFIL